MMLQEENIHVRPTCEFNRYTKSSSIKNHSLLNKLERLNTEGHLSSFLFESFVRSQYRGNRYEE